MLRRRPDEPEADEHPWLGRRDAAGGVLRRLELDITMRLDGLLQGDYRGLVPGHGSEPGETRRYEPGDDVRRIEQGAGFAARIRVETRADQGGFKVIEAGKPLRGR